MHRIRAKQGLPVPLVEARGRGEAGRNPQGRQDGRGAQGQGPQDRRALLPPPRGLLPVDRGRLVQARRRGDDRHIEIVERTKYLVKSGGGVHTELYREPGLLRADLPQVPLQVRDRAGRDLRAVAVTPVHESLDLDQGVARGPDHYLAWRAPGTDRYRDALQSPT